MTRHIRAAIRKASLIFKRINITKNKDIQFTDLNFILILLLSPTN